MSCDHDWPLMVECPHCLREQLDEKRDELRDLNVELKRARREREELRALLNDVRLYGRVTGAIAVRLTEKCAGMERGPGAAARRLGLR